MDSTIIGAIIGVIVLVLINIAVVAYSYGKVCQKVSDLCRRVSRLEQLANNNCNEGKDW